MVAGFIVSCDPEITPDFIADLLQNDRKVKFARLIHQDVLRYPAQTKNDKIAEVLEGILLNEEDHKIRLAAARVLGWIGSDRSSFALIKALRDNCPAVRHEVIAALGSTGGIGARDALMSILDSKSCYVRSISARSLLHISDVPPAEIGNLDLLIGLMGSEDVRVRDAILQIGDPAISFLKSRLKEGPLYHRRHAAQLLALNIKKLADQQPVNSDFFSWLSGHGISPQDLADLYSFNMIRHDGLVKGIESLDFYNVSRILCGERRIKLESEALEVGSIPMIEDSMIEESDLESILAEKGAVGLEVRGRTCLARTDSGYLAIKLGVKPGDELGLLTENRMQRFLHKLNLLSRLPIPEGDIIKIRDLPAYVQRAMIISKPYKPYAICYTADNDYFTYLNDPRISYDEFRRGLEANARDLAFLLRQGLIHTSLIPLFHNAERITQCSAYNWHRKVPGRIDNWLDSCRYPNLRLSGIADLEHIEYCGEISSKDLQVRIGEHLLAMSLILGSYFRLREKFDLISAGSMLKWAFESYCRVFTGSGRLGLSKIIDWSLLAARMAEEMEVNRYSDDPVDRQGKLKYMAGPHLGALNGPFPIPELIKSIHLASALAVIEVQTSSNISIPQAT